MTVTAITQILEELAPLHYAEDFDNVGLLVGDPNQIVTGILVTLDTLENVVDEAIAKKSNLIISFHPILFKGIKKLTGKNYVERVLIKAIQHKIAIYSMHTALDNAPMGVNAKICEVLEINNPKILIPKKGTIQKLVTYVPKDHVNKIREALFSVGAGAIGNYKNCSFSTLGTGSFKATEKANPTIGTIGETHYEKEEQLNITFSADKEAVIIETLFKNHPYEEVAYELTTLENTNQKMGMGMIGTLDKPVDEIAFMVMLKKKMKAKVIRHSNLLGKKIEKVAVLGGSGAFAIKAAISQNADVFITADVKYHNFFEAENRMVIMDIGHFETEQFTKNLLVDFLTKKIPNFAIALSESVTNPIKYF
jgi:dinuclear metal center YbgI/SA1388 family protein